MPTAYRDMILWEGTPNATVEDVIKYFLSESVQDDNDINNLSESVKFSQFSKIFRRVLDSIKKKTDVMDFRDIDASKGDLEKIDGFETYDKALKQLRQANSRKDSILYEIEQLKNNIIKYRTEFKKAYTDMSFTGKCLYRSAVYTFFYSMSVYLSTCITVEVPSGGGKIQLKVDVKREMEKTFCFQSVRKLNKYFSDGKIKEFFKKDVFDDNGQSLIKTVKESYERTLEDGSEAVPIREDFGISIGIIIGIPIAIFGIIFAIREIIYYFYKFRKYLSNEFTIAAEYLELNAELQSDKSTRKKQLEIANRYRKIAEKIAVKSDLVTKQVNAEIKKELVEDNKYIAQKDSLAKKIEDAKDDNSDFESGRDEPAPDSLF